MGKMCQVCDETAWKYKCPKCLVRYCSVDCFKQHQCKEKILPAPKTKKSGRISEQKPLNIDPDDDSDVLKSEDLSRLNCIDIKKILENPHLRNILMKIDSGKEPELMLEQYAEEPILAEFTEQCLKMFPSE